MQNQFPLHVLSCAQPGISRPSITQGVMHDSEQAVWRTLPLFPAVSFRLYISKSRLARAGGTTSLAKALVMWVSVSGLPSDTRPESLMVMAFSFLEPITAPKPPWPQAEELPAWIVAMRLNRSPAGPITMECAPLPSID